MGNLKVAHLTNMIIMTSRKILILLSMLSIASAEFKCKTNSDCSQLGTCNFMNGVCICDQGWKGENCGLVDLLPTPRYGGYRNESMASWGGTAVEIDGIWHMYASAISNQCPLNQFSTNSFSIHATSWYAGGPYEYHDTVHPEFHHGTTILKVNDSTLALYTDGQNMHGKNVHDCTGNGDNTPNFNDDLDDEPVGPNDFYTISFSNDGPDGPWDERVIFETDFTNLDKWNCNKTNTSPILMENGTVLLMYRGTPCNRDPNCKNDTINLCEHVGIAVANSVEGPYEDRQGKISQLSGNEDAVFFKTKRGYAAIFHGKNGCKDVDGVAGAKVCGRLAHSVDSWDWILNDEPCYDGTIQWREENGDVTEEVLQSRQRPKIFFAKDGVTPLYLSNGVEVKDADLEFTVASPFNVQPNW